MALTINIRLYVLVTNMITDQIQWVFPRFVSFSCFWPSVVALKLQRVQVLITLAVILHLVLPQNMRLLYEDAIRSKLVLTRSSGMVCLVLYCLSFMLSIPWIWLWPNLKAAVAKTLPMFGFTEESYSANTKDGTIVKKYFNRKNKYFQCYKTLLFIIIIVIKYFNDNLII